MRDGEDLAIHMEVYSRYSSGVTERNQGIRSSIWHVSYQTRSLYVHPRHITVTLISSLRYLRMVKDNRIDVMTLGTYFEVRRFKIFKKLAYVKKRVNYEYVTEYVGVPL
jgi:hypothetical protein